MFYFVYDCVQFLAILAFLPRLLWSFVFQRKSCSRLSAYTGFSLPKKQERKELSFLIYAVSMGETKAAALIFKKMKVLYPNASFYVASRTETGHEEAKRSLKGADCHFYLPLDFSWNIRRLLKRLKPTVLIVVESDLWINLLKESKKLGSFVFLVSGRISLRSYERFLRVPSIAKKLFGLFDLICAQNTLFQSRFISLGAESSKILVTGNIKLDAERLPCHLEDIEHLKKMLGIKKEDLVVVVGSTHFPEEVEVLKVFESLWDEFPTLRLLVAPRHPERFSKVEEILVKSRLSFIAFSRIQEKKGNEKIVLIDVMGKLSSLYQLADLAITCGSFEKRLSGHNILEPVLSGAPVLFGPYMKDQKDLVSLVLSYKAGMQLDLKDLGQRVRSLLKSPEDLLALKGNGDRLALEIEGSSQRTLASIQSVIS